MEAKANPLSDLANEISLELIRYGADPDTARAKAHMLLHGYDVTAKSTDIVPYQGNLNDQLFDL